MRVCYIKKGYNRFKDGMSEVGKWMKNWKADTKKVYGFFRLMEGWVNADLYNVDQLLVTIKYAHKIRTFLV